MITIILLCCLLNLPLTEGREEKCLQNVPDVFAKKQFKVKANNVIQLIPLRLHYGRHTSQQITTHILKILAEEALGYENVQLLDDKSHATESDIIKTIGGCLRCQQDGPAFMVDTEVWLPFDYHNIEYIDKGLVLDTGPITEYGRYGWFMSSSFIQNQWTQNRIIANHWKSLSINSILSQLELNKTLLLQKRNITELQQYCLGKDECMKKIVSSSWCGNEESCLLMLADVPGLLDSITYQQIIAMNLNISLVWLGSKLTQTVLEYLKTGQPFLLLNWEPNTLTSNGNLTRVVLPSCSYNPSFLQDNHTVLCDYPLMQLKKLAWHQVQQGAPDFYHLLQQLYLTRKDLNQLLHQHQDMGGSMSSKELACQWLRHKESVWLSWLPSGIQSGKVPVYLGGLFPMTQNDGALWVRPGILTGAIMALEKINKDTNILTNYTLHIITKNTQCQTSLVLDSYIQFVSPQQKLSIAGILGPACSIQAEIVAEVSPFYNTIVMGYSLEGISLANRRKYPLFFRTSPSYTEFKKAYSALFHHLGWTQYAALTDVNYASGIVNAIHEYLADRDIHLVYSRFIALQESDDIHVYLESIRKSNARIIIAHMFEDVARKVICEAIKEKMTPDRGYVWFLPSWLRRDWFLNNITHRGPHSSPYSPLIKCTDSEMLSFIRSGYFSLDNAFFASGNTNIVGGYTVDEWREVYFNKVTAKAHPVSHYASFAYDAVWAYAFALDKLFTHQPSALDTIRTNATTQLLKDYLQESNFTGVSGHVTFKAGERYLPTVNIVQNFGHDMPVTVGQFIPTGPGQHMCESNEGCLEINETLIAWPDNERPHDGRPRHRKQHVCAVESFSRLTGLTCDWAIAVINIIAIGLFLIVVISLIWVCIKRRYDNKYKKTRQRMEELGLMYQSPIMQLDDWEVPREDVVLNRKLGEGAFGTVFGGEAKGLDDQCEWMPVAVKTLKVGSSLEEKLEFLSEAETMKVFNHRNIVKLLGVCTKGEPALAIMELMIHGDLKSFLLARRQFVNQSCKEAEDVTPTRLTNMAFEIASGLAYLSNLKYVHRDLALRNCMVGSGNVVKLGDFGMTRAMYDSDYYRFGRKGMLPVRWMAPESLADGVFTTKSDVWGLGVTLWELCTLGSFPYQGLSNSEVVVYVKEENIMDMPSGCTQKLSDLLFQCWRPDPNDRPEPITIMEMLANDSKMITPCLDAPIASIAPDDDDILDTDTITADKPTSPRLISRKFSRSAKLSQQPMRSPTSTRSQRPPIARQLSQDQLKTMIDSLTPPGSPSQKERKEEFV